MQQIPKILQVEVETILPLRQKILRAGMPGLSARFEGDDDAGTVHIAASIEGAIVGCVTFLRSAHEGLPAWQMRGMAIDAPFQGAGLGRLLLAGAEKILEKPDSPRLWWCNAREEAAGFYEKLGWKKVSERFEVPVVGIHYRMIYNL